VQRNIHAQYTGVGSCSSVCEIQSLKWPGQNLQIKGKSDFGRTTGSTLLEKWDKVKTILVTRCIYHNQNNLAHPPFLLDLLLIRQSYSRAIKTTSRCHVGIHSKSGSSNTRSRDLRLRRSNINGLCSDDRSLAALGSSEPTGRTP